MKNRKAFARLDPDVGKLAREHAKANGRTLQSEINFALRAVYKPKYPPGYEEALVSSIEAMSKKK